MGKIYIFTSPSGKSYVGQTTRDIEERFGEHQEIDSTCRAIRNAIQYYGWDSFIVDYYECPDDELNKNEKWMVDLMGTLSPGGYNLREGGGSRGKFSDDTKKKLSESRVGEKNHRFGTHPSEETKQKIKDSWTEERRKYQILKQNGLWIQMVLCSTFSLIRLTDTRRIGTPIRTTPYINIPHAAE